MKLPDSPSHPEADEPTTFPETHPLLLNPPLQERSRRTLQKLLSAGIALLEAEGPEALTVGAITGKARVSVGSFYSRFQGKDDLLRFLGESALAEALDHWENRTGDAGSTSEDSPELESAELALDALLSLFLEGPGRTLALLHEVQDPPPSRRRRLEVRIAGGVAEMAGLDPVRSGLRVRALVGLLHDAARHSLLGRAGDVEYGFLPGRTILREEGLALLLAGAGSPWSEGRGSEVGASVVAEEDVSVEAIEEVSAADETPPEETPPEPAPAESDPLAEPDPFDVWG